MAILTTTDFSSSSFTADQIASLIISAQRMAESPLGAGRPLEVAEFREILSVNKVMQTVQLSYWPITNGSVPIIEIRQATTLTYGRSHGTSEWQTLTADEYILDETGKLHLNAGNSTGFRLHTVYQADEVRATYTSGFDFSANSYDIEQIKSAVLAIATAQSSQQYQSNISSVSINDEVSVKFGSGGSGGDGSARSMLANPSGLSLQESLMFLKKYKSRGIL